MTKSYFGDNLYTLRKQRGLSQDEFAEKMGVSRQAISKWERNESYPDTENLIAIAKFFGVSIDDMINTSLDAKSDSEPEDKATVTVVDIDLDAGKDTVNSRYCSVNRTANNTFVTIKLIKPTGGEWTVNMTSKTACTVNVSEIMLYNLTLSGNIPKAHISARP